MAKMAKWRRHTVEFKRQVVERMKTCENIEALAGELNIQRHANLGITAEDRKEKHLRDEIAKLKSALADKTLENDFFRSALRKVKRGRQQNPASGATASTTSSNRGRKSKAH